MLLDFEVQRCSRRCSTTEREFAPGDVCYSILEINGAEVVRKDFCAEGWHGVPESAFGWWKSRIPEPTARKIKLAPNDVLLELFDRLADRPDQTDLRYVLALLLIRRRVLRVDVGPGDLGAATTQTGELGIGETMTVYCPKRDSSYYVAVDMPRGARVDEIQQQLSALLIADAE